MSNYLDVERMRFVELRRRIIEIHPDMEEQTLADTLEGATNLKEALAAIIRSAIEDEFMAKALKDRLEALRQRLARLEARAASKRQAALLAMDQADMRKLVEHDFTASVRFTPQAVEITDQSKLPMHFLIQQPPKVDKRAVLSALSEGEEVVGAIIAPQKLSLSVRIN